MLHNDRCMTKTTEMTVIQRIHEYMVILVWTAVSRLSPVTMIGLRFAILSCSMTSVLVGLRLFLNFMNPMNWRFDSILSRGSSIAPSITSRIPTVKLKIPGKRFLKSNPELLLHSSYCFWPKVTFLTMN